MTETETGPQKKIIWAYYLFQFFFSMLLWLPIFYEYQKSFGITDKQFFDIQSLYYIVFCLFELPTGFVADRFGYRTSLLLGAVSLVVANALPIFWTTFAGFLTHFILIAAARSFVSGAGSAYMYEYMLSYNAGGDFKRVEGNSRAYGLYGKVVLWPTVGVMMTYKIELPYIATTLCSVAALLVLWRGLPSETGFLKKAASKKFSDSVIALVKVLKHSPKLVMLMLQGTGIFVLARILQVNLFQPILKQNGFSIETFGSILATMTIFEAIGSNKPHWLRRFGNDSNLIFILTLLLAVAIAVIGFSDAIGTLIGLGLFSTAIGFSYPIQRQLLNDNIQNPEMRASILSTESILDRTICAAVAPFIGAYVTTEQLNHFLIITSTTTALIMLTLYVWSKRLK